MPVQAHDLASGPETRVDAQDGLPAEGRGEEQLAQIGGEDTDRFRIRTLLGFQPCLGLDRGFEQPPVPVLDGEPDLLGGRTGVLEEHAVQQHDGLVFGRHQSAGEHTFRFAPTDRQDPVRRRLGGRLLPLEVVLELGAVDFFAGDDLRAQDALGGEEAADGRAGSGIVADPLREDVAGTGQRLIGGCNARLLVDKRRGAAGRIGGRILRPQQVRQRLQPLLPGDHGARAAFRTVGLIDILQRGQRRGGLEGRREVVGQELALDERFHDRLSPLGQGLELLETVANSSDGDLVQRAGLLLAVAGDEGNRAAVLQERRGRFDLASRDLQFGGDRLQECVTHMIFAPWGFRTVGRGCRSGVSVQRAALYTAAGRMSSAAPAFFL